MIIQNRIPMAIDDFGLHLKFNLNGVSFSKTNLKEFAQNIINEGAAFEKSIGNFLLDWLDEKPSIEVTTSGSTGKPKTILLQKKQMVNSALATGSFFKLKEEDTALLCLSADYIAGKMMLVRAMVLGLHLDYIEPSSSPLNMLLKNYDFVAMVPLQLENSLTKIDSIKTIIVGGASISKTLINKLQAKRTAIFETYGMTETITHIAVKRVNNFLVEGKSNHLEALPNVYLSQDDRDCLVISAPKVSKNPVITNDIVHLISETEFEWLGRYDNVINSGGVKLFPEQIEAKLEVLISNRFFVAGILDENLGQKLVLLVEGEIDSKTLLKTLHEENNLERFEIPKNVFVLPKFIETETGKIRRKENLLLI